jgi:hypothetical protein
MLLGMPFTERKPNSGSPPLGNRYIYQNSRAAEALFELCIPSTSVALSLAVRLSLMPSR